MSNPQDTTTEPHESASDAVAMPRPTVAPLTLALGLALLAAGAPFGMAFLIAGAGVLVVGLGMWVAELLPGRGHFHEPLVEPEARPRRITAELAAVAQLRPGMPGYRTRLPESVHPLSAGIKGGLVGGLVMPLPALLYGILSKHGIWYPVNLLSGMVLPSVGTMTVAELEQFHLTFLLLGIFIHATISVVFGLIFGVLLPMLPTIGALRIPKALAWGGLILPLLWTAISYGLMGVTNPVLQARVDWPWFVVSQFVFGAVAAYVVDRSEKIPIPPAGRGAE